MAVCDKALAFRKEQEDALGHSGGCSHARAKKLGDVTTLNLTSKTRSIMSIKDRFELPSLFHAGDEEKRRVCEMSCLG